MYLFCVRRCRRPGAATDVNFFFIEVSGAAPEDVARKLKKQGIVIKGFREGSVLKVLKRYIPIAAAFGGVCKQAFQTTTCFCYFLRHWDPISFRGLHGCNWLRNWYFACCDDHIPILWNLRARTATGIKHACWQRWLSFRTINHWYYGALDFWWLCNFTWLLTKWNSVLDGL